MNATLTFIFMGAMIAAHVLLMWELRPGSKTDKEN